MKFQDFLFILLNIHELIRLFNENLRYFIIEIGTNMILLRWILTFSSAKPHINQYADSFD